MTDLRKLLEDARSALYALGEKHYDKIAERIDAALAEPVEPVGEFSGMRITPEGTREFYGHIEPGSIPPLPGTKLYAAPADQWRRVEDVSGLPMIIAGALYDFGGFLTTRDKVMKVGATENASPMVDAIKEFAALRNLSLEDAAVLSWQETLTALPESDK